MGLVYIEGHNSSRTNTRHLVIIYLLSILYESSMPNRNLTSENTNSIFFDFASCMWLLFSSGVSTMLADPASFSLLSCSLGFGEGETTY